MSVIGHLLEVSGGATGYGRTIAGAKRENQRAMPWAAKIDHR
ncbi:hypothetical protein [Haladaptatus sp. W1]|nr:hypothetical protein [Haladaptatus sp. W1]